MTQTTYGGKCYMLNARFLILAFTLAAVGCTDKAAEAKAAADAKTAAAEAQAGEWLSKCTAAKDSNDNTTAIRMCGDAVKAAPDSAPGKQAAELIVKLQIAEAEAEAERQAKAIEKAEEDRLAGSICADLSRFMAGMHAQAKAVSETFGQYTLGNEIVNAGSDSQMQKMIKLSGNMRRRAVICRRHASEIEALQKEALDHGIQDGEAEIKKGVFAALDGILVSWLTLAVNFELGLKGMGNAIEIDKIIRNGVRGKTGSTIEIAAGLETELRAQCDALANPAPSELVAEAQPKPKPKPKRKQRGNIRRMTCPGGETPAEVGAGCMCNDGVIKNPCGAQAFADTQIKGRACVFNCSGGM